MSYCSVNLPDKKVLELYIDPPPPPPHRSLYIMIDMLMLNKLPYSENKRICTLNKNRELQRYCKIVLCYSV